MTNNIQCSIESSTTKIELNSAAEGVFLVPELEGLAGLPEIRTTSGVNAGYDGGWTSAQNYDARLISIRGIIANPDVAQVESKRRAIASLLGQGRKEQLTLRLTTEAGNSYSISVRTISCEMALQRVLTTQEFLIQLRADDPLIYDDGASSGTEAVLQVQKALGGFEINFELPLAIGGGAEDTIVENGSETVYPIISLYGPLHSPTVVNRTTNQQMQILADLQYTISWSGYQPKDIGAYDQLENELDGAPMLLSQLTGNATQTTYSGKNKLAPTASFSETVNGVTYTSDGNGKYTINGTASAGGSSTRMSVENYTIQSGDYLHFMNNGVSASSAFVLVFTDATTASPTMTPANRIYSLASQVGKTVEKIYFYSSSTAAITSPITLTPMIINSATATDWEQYVGGTASPNPDYPQAINTVTGEQTVKVEGKNLFDINTLANGTITVTSGVATGTALQFHQGFGTNGIKTLMPNGQLAITATAYTDGNSSTAQTVGLKVRATYTDGTSADILTWDNSNTTATTKTGTTSSSKTVSKILLTYQNSGSNTWHLSNVQLELGSQATSYEAFQSQTKTLTLASKNVFNPETLPSTWTNTSATYKTLSLAPNTTYTFSSNIPRNSGNALIFFIEQGQSIGTNTNGVWEGQTRTLTTNSTGTNLQVVYRSISGESYTRDDYEFQLEKGQTASDYVAFYSYELAKIGTYQDRIYKDEGKWYIEKQVGKLVFDGNKISGSGSPSQDAGQSNAESALFYCGAVTDAYSETPQYSSMTISDYLVAGNVYSGSTHTENGYFIAANNKTLAIRMRGDIIGSSMTVSDFMTWFSAHPTTVYYALATPTDTEITDATLLAQLNFVASLYGGVNNISLIGTGAQGQIVVKYATVKTINQDVAVIDSQARTITLNGQDIYHLKSEESEFLLLAPGENKLYLTSATDTDEGYAEVKFKQGYLSI